MGLSAVLLLLVVIGAIVAFLIPGVARVLGWLTVIAALVTAVSVVSKFTAGGTGELPGQIGLVIGGAIALVVLVVGGAIALGLLAGRSAVATVAVEQIDNVNAGALTKAAAATASLIIASGEQPNDGILRTAHSGSEHEIPLLKRGFLEGQRPNRDDISVLAHAALTDKSIATMADRLSGETLLHWSAKLNLPEAAARLLDCGANPNAANGRGLRPFAGCDDEFIERVRRSQAPKA